MFDWLRKLLHKKRSIVEENYGALDKYFIDRKEEKNSQRQMFIPKTGSQASRQDIGKFMKHGRQSPMYRKSIKAKIQPDDEED